MYFPRLAEKCRNKARSVELLESCPHGFTLQLPSIPLSHSEVLIRKEKPTQKKRSCRPSQDRNLRPLYVYLVIRHLASTAGKRAESVVISYLLGSFSVYPPFYHRRFRLPPFIQAVQSWFCCDSSCVCALLTSTEESVIW